MYTESSTQFTPRSGELRVWPDTDVIGDIRRIMEDGESAHLSRVLGAA